MNIGKFIDEYAKTSSAQIKDGSARVDGSAEAEGSVLDGYADSLCTFNEGSYFTVYRS